MDEAEVEHLVGLVEDEDLDVAQAQRPAVDEVEEPAGRGDEDVDAGREVALLLADRHAAEHDGGRQLRWRP